MVASFIFKLCYVMTVGALRPVNFSNCEMLRAMSSKGFKTTCGENINEETISLTYNVSD